MTHENNEHIDNVLEEARIKVLGEEVVKIAENHTYYTGEIMPKDMVDEAENLTYLAGVIEPAETVRDAELITAYETEVKAVGEDLPEDEKNNGLLNDLIDSEAARMFAEYSEDESAEDARAREKYEAEKKAAEQRAKEINKQIETGTNDII